MGAIEDTCVARRWSDAWRCLSGTRSGAGRGVGAAGHRRHRDPAGRRTQHAPARQRPSQATPSRARAGGRRRGRCRRRAPVRHRDRHDHHRCIVDRHHVARDRALAGPTIAGHAGARAGHPGAQPVRRRERRADAPSTCAASVPPATSNTLVLDQRPPAQRHRPCRRRFQHASRANSIERIEITRGNSGAVLYGDGAVGGVINIVTKTGVDLPPSARICRQRSAPSTTAKGSCRRTVPAGPGPRRPMATPSAPTAIARTTSCSSRTRSAISAGPTSRAPRLSQPVRRQPAPRACRAAGW